MHATDLPKSVMFDLASSVLGRPLGSGMTRQVFEWVPNTELVVKLETGRGFQNTIEWETWHALKDTKHGGWLCPVVWISDCGTALLMHRTRPMIPGEEPKSMPAWLSDHKRANYGVFMDRVVCHDYGTNLLLNHGAFTGKRGKPEWWD